MTNPLGPPGEKDENIEKRKADEKPADGLTFGDVLSRDVKDQRVQEFKVKEAEALRLERSEKPAIGPPARELGNFAKSPLAYTLGQKPPFQLKKSEFLHAKTEKPVTEMKPLVDKFLTETPGREDRTLSQAERAELKQSRESLARFTSADDALTRALHLARLYQHLRYVEEAKKATDLALGIDPESHIGRELFKELERVHPPDVGVKAPVTRAPGPLSKANLRNRIMSMSGGRVIVVGDQLIDELLEGKPERISREAPVLILEHVDTELIPGGAANTAHNIVALGGVCHAAGVCGRDEYAAKLAALFDRLGISHSLVQDPARPTTVKTRILSKSHSFTQQLLRLDRISHEPVGALVEGILIDKLRQVGGQFRAIVLSDYRGGVITDGVIAACRQISREHGLLLVVDAQDRFERFQDPTLMTPNQPDTEKAVGFTIDSRESLKKAGDELMLLTGAKAVLITRGGHGMALFEQGQELLELAVFNKSEVFDVTGAGDTVVATMALALVTGASYLEAMALGNLAAGIVVRKQGTAVTSQKEMLENLELLDLED